MGGKRDLADALESVGLFSRCTARERRTIARHAQTASFPPDTDLVIEGEPGDALFIILSGTAVLGIRMFRTLLREVPDLAEQLLVGLAGQLRTAQGQVAAETSG